MPNMYHSDSLAPVLTQVQQPFDAMKAALITAGSEAYGNSLTQVLFWLQPERARFCRERSS